MSEVLPILRLSPEHVGDALNLEADEVRAQMRSVEGRRQLLQSLKNDPEKLAAVIDPNALMTFERDMDMVQQDLAAEHRFLEAQKQPEKKGLFRRAWDTITGFPRKHPIITVTLLGVVLGVVASYMGWLPKIDFGGLWGGAQRLLGWGSASAAGEAAAELGTEVAADAFPEGLGIKVFEHNYIYGDRIYSMEELPQLLEQLPANVSNEEFIRIFPYANARVTAEMALKQALEERGLASSVLEKFAETEFVPANP